MLEWVSLVLIQSEPVLTFYEGKTLMRRYRMAVPERNRQVEAHRGFTASLDDSDVAEWMKMCEE
jgi:hypothetical protein